jgi:hypothetical protein
MPFKHITRALREGGHLHAFRSGGGLRVIRVEKGRHGELLGYGEHVHVQAALKLANKTLGLFGRLPKKSVFLTGDPSAEDALDRWLLAGLEFDAQNEGDEIVVQLLNRYYEDTVPDEVLQAALKNGTAEWENRGVTYLYYNVSYAKGSEYPWGYSAKTIKGGGVLKSVYTVAKTGHGKDFDEALKNALEAPQLEVEQKKAA